MIDRVVLSLGLAAFATACTNPSAPAGGFETGPCVQGECFDGLSCLSHLCVADGGHADTQGAGWDDGPTNPGLDDGAADDNGGSASDAADGSDDGDGPGDGPPTSDDGGTTDGGLDGGPTGHGSSTGGDSVGDHGGTTDGGVQPPGTTTGSDTAGDEAGQGGTTDDGGVGETGGTANACCVPTNVPGCVDGAVEACVCFSDAYCCDTAWDSMCVDGSAACGQTCGATGVDPVCCVVAAFPGCVDAGVEACVCGLDPTCCSTAWSANCVLAAAFCGGGCLAQ